MEQVLSNLISLTSIGILPISLELGVECTYPLEESISANYLLLSANLTGMLFILTMERIPSTVLLAGRALSVWIMTFVVIAGAVLLLFYFGKLKRREAEHSQLDGCFVNPCAGLN